MAIWSTSAVLISSAALAGCASSRDPVDEANPAQSAASLIAAEAGAVVTDGSARFTVLTPTLIRLEYAEDLAFQDATTFNAVQRELPAAPFTTGVSADGFREIRTTALTLRYRRGSGPFTPANVSVLLTDTNTTAAPAFPSYCVIGAPCEAENALLDGRASTAYDHSGHTGSAFVAGFESAGSGVSVDISGVPVAGTYRLAVRYANSVGSDGQSAQRTLSTRINGAAGPALVFPPTASWNDWSAIATPVTLAAGTNTISIVRGASDSGRINVDSLAITPASSTAYPIQTSALLSTGYGAGPPDTLGGWSRSLDNPQRLPVPMHPGILNRHGWYLLDDSRTALLDAGHVVADRPSHGRQVYQDGYFFGYGQNYRQALGDLNALSGRIALLPQSAYGVWYSRFFAHTAADYRNTILPQFRGNFTPIDWLVVDTDWKSPSQWNGWNWNTQLFPDPPGFMTWAAQQGLSVTLNIHPSIAGNDPRFAAANARAGGLLQENPGAPDPQFRFDWSRPAQLAAYLDLHQPFEQQGVRTWWLDYCTSCGSSTASDPHVAPDNLINQAYADRGAARGLRGFSFARIGGSEYAGDDGNYPIGPWSERRNTLQFTGDTPATWEMMAFEVRFTADEAAAGLSNISHDIGSFHGGHLAEDMYARWVQLGTFQPIDRLHSDHGDRLPWSYQAATAASAKRFLRLRESLVPYTYTLAHEAHATGVPIVRPMYLHYPTSEAAYTASNEYLFGDAVLVAPITSPNDASGNAAANVWVPPGSWTDYFTGVSYTGPATVSISAGLLRMPVLLKAGGIVPMRTDYVDNAAQRPLSQLTLSLAAGADGQFSLYQDAGEGPVTQSATTVLSWADAARTLTIGASVGSAPGAPAARAYTLRLLNAVAPTAVRVDGVQVPETDWAYNPNTRTVTVTTASLSLNAAHTVSLSGSATANPTSGEVLGAGGLCLDVRGGTSSDGTPMQITTCNHTAAQLVSYRADRSVQVLGKCLQVAGNATGNGAVVVLSTCNGATGQIWTRLSNGALVNPASGRCLDVPSGNTVPGAVQLQIWDCNPTAAQTWRMPPGPVIGPAGLCVDVADADPASGAAIQLFTCNQTDAQRWSAPGDETIRVFGKCLDVVLGGTANGTQVQLWDCNGSDAQKWSVTSAGVLVNRRSGRCLDDPDNRQRAGDLLRIWDCNTSTAQQFRLD
jgi:hypothetical protein